MQGFNLSEEQRALVAGWLNEPEEPELFEVFEENWPTLKVFLELRGSWNILSSFEGGLRYIGLDWSKVESYLRMLKIDDTVQYINDLRVMQDAALLEWYPPEETA